MFKALKRVMPGRKTQKIEVRSTEQELKRLCTRIGAALLTSQLLETTVDRFAREVLQDKETRTKSKRAQLNTMIRRMEAHGAKLGGFVKLLDELRLERNSMVHGFFDLNGIDFLTIKGKKALYERATDVQAKAYVLIQALEGAIQDHYIALGFHVPEILRIK